jgi:NADPH2:quinone reductase
MKGYELRSYDGPRGLQLADLRSPTPGPGDLVVKVHAIGVNFPDLLMTCGDYQLRPELPVVPGCEIAGTILHAPQGSARSVGDRVCEFIWQGGYAEEALIPEATAVDVPDSVELLTAAGMIVNYQTAMFGLAQRAHLLAGEKVLVLGAGGGIGTASIQVARGLDGVVIAGVANAEQADTARDAGANDILVLEPGFSTRVRELAGSGMDVVVDPLGDWLFHEALRSLNPEGRLLVLGFAAGQIPKLSVHRLLHRNVGVIGAGFGAFLEIDPQLVQRQAARLFELLGHGVVRPQIEAVYNFAELPQALERLQRGDVRGKAVVAI